MNSRKLISILLFTLIISLFVLIKITNSNEIQKNTQEHLPELETFWSGFDCFFNVVGSNENSTGTFVTIDEFVLSNNTLKYISQNTESESFKNCLIIGNQTPVSTSFRVFALVDGYFCGIRCASDTDSPFLLTYTGTIENEQIIIPFEINCSTISDNEVHEVSFFVSFDKIGFSKYAGPTILSITKRLLIEEGNDLSTKSRNWLPASKEYIEQSGEEIYFTQDKNYTDNHTYILDTSEPTFIVCHAQEEEKILIYFLIDNELLLDETGQPVYIEGSASADDPFLYCTSGLFANAEKTGAVTALVLRYPSSTQNESIFAVTNVYTLVE